MKQQDSHVFSGMQRDLSVSKQKSEHLYEAWNIRLTNREGDNLLSITNEKGTQSIKNSLDDNDITFYGTHLGSCVLGNYLIVFTTVTTGSPTKPDYIYRIQKNENTYTSVILYNGNLGFSLNHPIEALGIFENELVQKVYWTDGKNQPRYINIVKDQYKYPNDQYSVSKQAADYNNESFDFIQSITLKEKIRILKQPSSAASFAAGVIQYCFTYFNKYEAETNIFYTSPLLYINYNDRAGSAEEKCGNAFRINFYNIDTKFDYLRIYSIHRTSLNATPYCRKVTDVDLSKVNTITQEGFNIIDDGTIGSTIDPAELLYIGGETITAGTINQKDNTLFLGDIKITRPVISNTLKHVITGDTTYECDHRRVVLPKTIIKDTNDTSGYFWYNSLNALVYDLVHQTDGNTPTAGFKWREQYRLGIQFQYKTGQWSDPVYINDVIQTEYPKFDDAYNNHLLYPIFKYTMPDDADTELLSQGYKRARAVIAVPNLKDRLVITQGILCPTVYNLALRDQGITYAQSSWFTRPFLASDQYPKGSPWDHTDAIKSTDQNYYKEDDNNFNGGRNAKNGSLLAFTHGKTLYCNRDAGSEIQGIPPILYNKRSQSILDTVIAEDGGVKIRESAGEGATVYDNEEIHSINQLNAVYGVDQQFLTMHTPEVEFDTTLQSTDLSNVKFRRIGVVRKMTNYGDISITTSSPTIGNSSTGFLHSSTKGINRSLAAGLFYSDFLVDDAGNTGEFEPYYQCVRDKNGNAVDKIKHDFLYMVYPWHRNGSLNNDGSRTGSSAVLKRKVISNFKSGYLTHYYTYTEGNASSTQHYGKVDIYASKIFNSDEISMLKINGNNATYNYFGNIDQVLNPPVKYGSIFCIGVDATNDWRNKETPAFNSPTKNFNFLTTGGAFFFNSSNKWELSETSIGDDDNSVRYSKNLISMKYKSTPHMVLALNDTQLDKGTLYNGEIGLYIGEIYRIPNADLDFGGTTPQALQENIWIPAGEPVELSETGNTTVDFIYGDTWYQRYDCLRTYPFTQEDQNSVVDILSFFVESRINLDGRYDKNRGNTSNFYAIPTNYNLINTVYSQMNNFFTYRIKGDDYYKITKYPTTITWSKQKIFGEEVDTWSNITLASTLEMDGNKGKIVSLNTDDNNLYCFQERGLSQILFNSRVQIPTSDGVPVEISNSHKVDGSRFVSDSLGCKNKYSIVKTPSGLYFIDSISNSLMLLNNNQIQDVGYAHGFGYWFSQQNVAPWTPNNYSTKLFYDLHHKDMYTVNSICALGYSELLNQFTSFYNYNNTEAMFNIDNEFFAIKSNKLYKMFSGTYNKFFGTRYPSSLTYVSNENPTLDKTFTNLELRADFYTNTNQVCNNEFFKFVRAYNEYQDTENVLLTSKIYSPVDSQTRAAKKFRIWRIDLPRNKFQATETSRVKWDRLRNPWIKIKLQFDGRDSSAADNGLERFELHDINTIFYV